MGSTIYTYQKSKRKPIPLTRDRLLTLKEHERALKKLGVDSSRPTDLSDGPLVKRLSRLPVKQETTGSNPVRTATKIGGTVPIENWNYKRVKTLQLHLHTIKVHIKSLLRTTLRISANETSR